MPKSIFDRWSGFSLASNVFLPTLQKFRPCLNIIMKSNYFLAPTRVKHHLKSSLKFITRQWVRLAVQYNSRKSRSLKMHCGWVSCRHCWDHSGTFRPKPLAELSLPSKSRSNYSSWNPLLCILSILLESSFCHWMVFADLGMNLMMLHYFADCWTFFLTLFSTFC